MNQAYQRHGLAFSAIWRTLGLGTVLTMIGSTLLAVVFAIALDGCSRVATRIRPSSARAMTASAHPLSDSRPLSF